MSNFYTSGFEKLFKLWFAFVALIMVLVLVGWGIVLVGGYRLLHDGKVPGVHVQIDSK